ncbi:hypothetical protein U9M48_034378 [Paspalum notatum var. saurae]|uniref:J domain-containing protein n=1 Tax=Paspalum notatum var. saurae TaxID=547442 RepID=A0AAQ3U9M2_PASNO
MQAAAPWTVKTMPVLRSHLCDPTTRLASSSSFHSTPVSFVKWKNKWDCHKNYERYVVRQNRAEGKKALKDYLLYGKPSPHLQDGSTGSFANSHAVPRFKTFRKGPQTHWSSKHRVHNHRKSKKDKERFCNFFHEDHHVHPDDIFEAIFGANHPGFTWSNISWEGFHFGDKSFIFRWSGGGSRRERIPSDSEEDCGSEEDTRETTSVGSPAHRVILGLPPRGPLTLEDVKTAFRESALRWHPDRHPGSSQAVAEEKFKLCVNAYNSLCSVLKAA